MVLRVHDLSYEVGGRRVFSGVHLCVEPGSSAVVLGRSGSGKTTLLLCVLGLLRPAAGEIWLADHLITGMSRNKLAEVRRQSVGMVFQDGELLPELSAVENVALAALLSGKDSDVAYERAGALLEGFGVPSDTPTGTLSGGERQRTAVARALINEPAVLLADEPTGALDEANRDSVADLIFSLPQTQSCGLLVATHDLAIAERADASYRLSSDGLTAAAL